MDVGPQTDNRTDTTHYVISDLENMSISLFQNCLCDVNKFLQSQLYDVILGVIGYESASF